MLNDSQLAERKNYITGSDTSCILGVNPWKTAFDVWREKLGYIEAEDISDKPAVKAGNMLEPAIRKWFEHETGLKVHEPDKLIVHPQYEWMAGNLDGWIEEEQAVLEIKTASSDKKWGDSIDNVIPLNYLCQVAHYCEIMQAKKAYIAVLFNGVDFRIYNYEISRKLQDKIIDKTRHFWEYNIKEQVPPEPINFEEVKQIFPTPVADGTVADDSVEADINMYNVMYEQKKIYDERIKELKDRIAVAFRDKEAIVNAEGKVLATFKQDKSKMKFNEKHFKEENPELYKQYMIELPGSRRFLVKK